MSGGIAYVLDESRSFSGLCNASMVDLEAVLTESEQRAKIPTEVWHMQEADESVLRRLIGNHAKYTGSRFALKILDQWSAYRTSFVKVFPKEYRRALAENAASTHRAAA